MKSILPLLCVLPCVLFCIVLPLVRKHRGVIIAIMFFCLFLTLPFLLSAGNILDRTGNPTARPLVAFSLRQLSSAYTGNAIQVRRSSDNATQDIGFTTAGDLDTTSLKTFVGSGNGYVSIWYDQSGNNYKATQTTDAIQPTIMNNGVINRDNGQPSIYTAGGNGFLSYGPVNDLNGAMQVTRMEVARSRSSSFGITEGLGNFQLDLQLFPTSVIVQFENGNITTGGAVNNPTSLMAINSVRNNGASKLYVNTTLLGTSVAGLAAFNAPVWGYIGVRFDYALGNAGPGAFSETILFNEVLSDADRLLINCNQNLYYSLGFDAVCNNALLPINISSFTGKRVNEKTMLSWTTGSETSSEWFVIERSNDGSDWKGIGLVAAAGYSSGTLLYRFTDAVPEGNSLYYRLKLVDKDGRYTYSNIVLIKTNDDAVVAPQLNRIAPNPFRNYMEISYTVPVSGAVEVQLRNITGVTLIQRKLTAKKGNNVFLLTDLDALAPGIYTVRVVQGGTARIGKAIKG